MRKFREKNAKISQKNGNYAKKEENFAKNTEYLKTNAKFLRKSCENSSKRLNFENTRLIFNKMLKCRTLQCFTTMFKDRIEAAKLLRSESGEDLTGCPILVTFQSQFFLSEFRD